MGPNLIIYSYYYQKGPVCQSDHAVRDTHIGRPVLGYSLDQSSKRVSD